MSPQTDPGADAPPNTEAAADEMGEALRCAAEAAPRHVDVGGDEVNRDSAEIAADDLGASTLAESGDDAAAQSPT